MNQLCPTPHGIEREATSVAEHIEHLLALGILFEKGAILTLVDEEARLLTSQIVNTELEAILQSNGIVSATIEEGVLLTEVGLERKGCLTLVIDILDARTHNLNQLLDYDILTHVHADRVSLHDSSIAIAVYNKAREIVALAMNQTIGVVGRIVGYTDILTHLESDGEATVPE